jgi:hypothetical protein
MLVGCFAFGTNASASCCNLVKVDAEVPISSLRVCEPDTESACGVVLFEGSFTLGESQQVCTPEPTVVYEEGDGALGAFGFPVTAVCDGGDIEF